MAKNKYYTVVAGAREPKQVEFGTLNKDTGMPKPDVTKAYMAVGTVMVLNFSRVWGKRVLPSGDKKANDGPVQPTDPQYRGQLEFLDWGTPGGEVIEIRYLRNSNTLDKQYQDVVQKLRPSEDDVYINLAHGDNEFDEEKEALLVQFLKVCAYNRDSKYKDPEIWDWDFFESKDSMEASTKRQSILTRNTASNLVLEADAEKLAVLAVIFGEDARRQDKRIGEILLDKAESNPTAFVATVNRYKDEAGLRLRDAMEQQLVDVNAKGGIEYTGKDGQKKTLAVEGKGVARLEWVLDNLLTPSVFDAVTEIFAVLEKYQEAAAQ